MHQKHVAQHFHSFITEKPPCILCVFSFAIFFSVFFLAQLRANACRVISQLRSMSVHPLPLWFRSSQVNSSAVLFPFFAANVYSCSARHTSCSVPMPYSQHTPSIHMASVFARLVAKFSSSSTAASASLVIPWLPSSILRAFSVI